MSYVTPTLVVDEAVQCSLGEEDARTSFTRSIFQGAGEDFPLDRVFDAFCCTNSYGGGHYELLQLFKIDRKIKFGYTFDGVTFVATVRELPEWAAGPVTLLNLSNDGFVYSQKFIRTFYRHQREGWHQLEPSLVMPFFPHLSAAVRPYFDKAHVYYNGAACRLDLQFYPKTDVHYRPLFINFEPGSPEYKESKPPTGW